MPAETRAKRAKHEGTFPNFDDGDVSITLGTLELKLHASRLRGTCDYFAAFAPLPSRFVLQPTAPWSAAVAPVDSPSAPTNTADNNLTPRARAAHATIFRLLYGQPPPRPSSPTRFRDAATLATVYGCVDAVKAPLAAALLKANLGRSVFEIDPWALLDAACSLRDEAIFDEALQHVVGGSPHSANPDPDNEHIPPAVTDAVAEGMAALEEQIKAAWDAVVRCAGAETLPGALAGALLRGYLDRHVGCGLGGGLRGRDVYRVLDALHRMDGVEALLQGKLMAMVDAVDDGLQVGQDAVYGKGHQRYSDGDELQLECGAVEKAMAQDFNRKSVEEELEGMLEAIKKSVKPLFKKDRGVGYFTQCVYIEEYPWETSTSLE